MTNLSMETVGLACRCATTSELSIKLPPKQDWLTVSEDKEEGLYNFSTCNLHHSHLGQ